MKFSKSLLLFLAFGFIATASSIFFQDVQTSSAQLGQSGGSSIAVRDLILVNADTNQDIGPLTNGYTLNVSAFGTENYSVRAETQPSQVGSVRFALNDNANFQTENILPYALGGDSQGGTNYNPVVFEEGQNTITATPFTKRNGSGQSGVAKTITFNVVYGGQEGAPRGPEEDGGAENIVGNGVQAIAPDPSASYVPGQQGVPFTCDIGTDPGFYVWKLVFSSYQIAGGSTNVYTFATYEGIEYTTGQYTETVTIPEALQSGAYTFHCVAYFYDSNTGSYSVAGLSPAEDGLEVQIGSHQEPTGETNSISITSPTINSNVVVNQSFTFSVAGSPTNDEIQNVSFYMHPGFGGLDVDPILLGSDTSSPFSIQASVSDRYYRCPHIYAVADLNDGTQIKTTNLHPVAITESPTNSPWQCTPQSIGGNSYDFSITSPQWASTSDPGYDAGVPFTISAQNNLSGATMDYVKFYTADTFDGLNGWGFNLVSTDTTAPYTTQATINSPADYGHPYFTNHIRAIAYYSNGQVEPRLMPIKINPQVNPTTNPQITSLELVTASGQVIETLEGGEVINTGIGGYGPNISIRANANADTGSVLFNLQKPIGTHTQAENNTPYSLFGDSNGTYATWQDLQNGPHTLIVTPYELDGQTGVTGTPVTIQFSLENNDDLIAPSVPANVEIEYRSNSTARVSWDASTDNVGVTGYQVYKNGNVEGLSTGNLYKDLTTFQTGDVLTVRATDAAGNWSSDSNPVNIPILSTQFANGQTVSVSVPSGQTATVYSAPPSTSSNGNQTGGSQGTIQGSSVFWNGGYYWSVNFGSGPDGWVSQSQLTGGSTPPPPPTPVTSYSCPTTVISNDYSMMKALPVCASVSSSPNQITLNWSPVSGRTLGNVTIYRKTGYDSSSWSQVATNVSGSAYTWTDTNVVPGTYYEYKVTASSSSNYGSQTVNGYISSGINVSLEEFKGKIILVVDNTYQASLAQEIQDLKDELLADKWIVADTHYVSRNATPPSVRSLIQATYNQDPANTKAVYLIGRVPVAYSGNTRPDGHGSRAMASDAYYGEMTSTWNSLASGCSQFNWAPEQVQGLTGGNPPSPQASFCHSSTPSSVELQVGRVDMYNLSVLSSNDTSLTSNYLSKVTAYKENQTPANERVIVRDDFESNGASLATPVYSSISSISDITNTTVNNATWPQLATLVDNQSYLFVYGNSWGANNGVGTTNGVAGDNSSVIAADWGGVFNQIYGSYFGEWSGDNNFLRVLLSEDSSIGTMYGGNRHWYLHHMGMGQNIGYSVLKSINNTNTYDRIQDTWATGGSIGNSYMALMGDPTVRVDYVSKPSSLTINLSGGTANISWTSSPESGVIGYYVYKINQNNIVRLTNTPVAGNTYSVNASSGDKFMVTAVKPKVNASGNYLNESLGLIGVVGTQQSSGSSNTFSPGDSVIVTDGTN